MRVPARYSGPVGFANGGWLGGMLAECAGHGTTRVTLRRPIPVECDLAFDGSRLFDDGGTLVEVEAGEFALEPPAAASLEEAVDAEGRSLVRASGDYGLCFVCGSERADGLRIRPGALAERPGEVACTVRHGEGDRVAATWAALDCPGVWTVDAALETMLLGRMTATVVEAMEPGEQYVAVGRLDGREGRKMHTSTALYRGDRLIARAEQVWIALRQ